MKTLKVLTVENGLKDKNGKLYNKISLATKDFVMQDGVRIKIEPKVQNVVKYPESYLPDGSPQFGHDFKVGDYVAGDIVTLGNLFPYPIKDAKGTITRMATSASHVVLGNSDDASFEVAINREFSNRGCFSATKENIERYTAKWGFSPEGIDQLTSSTKEEVAVESETI